MRIHRLFFLLFRQQYHKHKRKVRKYTPETRTLAYPKRTLMIGQSAQALAWQLRTMIPAPVIRMYHSTLQPIRGTDESGAGYYFMADGQEYGPYANWTEIQSALESLTAREISDIEWREV